MTSKLPNREYLQFRTTLCQHKSPPRIFLFEAQTWLHPTAQWSFSNSHVICWRDGILLSNGFHMPIKWYCHSATISSTFDTCISYMYSICASYVVGNPFGNVVIFSPYLQHLTDTSVVQIWKTCAVSVIWRYSERNTSIFPDGLHISILHAYALHTSIFP